MTSATSEQRFREAAELEGGMPVSVGARDVHVRAALESGRMLYVDLSSVPESERPDVVADIKSLVDRASTRPAGETRTTLAPSAEMNA